MVLAQGVENTMSTGEAISFWVLGPLALLGALGMIFAKNAVHSALFLVLTMLSLGVTYMVQQAPFLGFVQIIVYTGAIMMLFLFVLMLVGRDSSDSVVEVLRGQRLAATILGIGLAVLFVGALYRSLSDVTPVGLQGSDANGGPGNVENIGRSIFTDWLFAFELTSALLITAAVGAMLLGYVDRQTRGRKTQREMVEARFRGEYARPSPLPGPGVFATASSVATPALLPDGSVAPESLSRLIDSAAVDEFEEERRAVAGTTPGADSRALNPSASEGDQS
ncbi:NADH:ubiquinone oxidoreductase subunit J [Actinophytocola xinjiangensis]|uniref:NADH-quinone oxidoreductase subunit J n=1 Tax=Actinophytocola xinjiangensis TaxID=485602 RepID=A0A7Z1AZ01_9PSEU|nr:NADH:ubiquinone oxidoreductase subunit J [Actinophytocola xinjiangensis]